MTNTEKWQSGRMHWSCPEGMPLAKTSVPQGTRSKKHRKMFFAYVLKNKIDRTHYYGHTKDLHKRLKEHNNGKVRSTKAKRPWQIHYHEEFATKSEAYKREMFFKSIDGYNFLKEKNII
ncbi:MAG: GIY-YIG nuclease family protein [Reichenbachiella sp.]|uniref:GIY-YIG nuclease family protein n=1 Tax=Reichenbachiella sp. TaxID=2184521 RepID=UPI0032635764